MGPLAYLSLSIVSVSDKVQTSFWNVNISSVLFNLPKLTVTLSKLVEGGIQDSQVFTIYKQKKI